MESLDKMVNNWIKYFMVKYFSVSYSSVLMVKSNGAVSEIGGGKFGRWA